MSRQILRQTIKSTAYFVFRSVILVPLGFFSTILLSRFLEPSDFGIYFAALFVINVVSSFSDIGLSASVVQKKENPTLSQLRTVFTFQLSLMICISLLLLLSTPLLMRYFKFDDPVLIWLFPLLALPLLFMPIKGVSLAILTRNLAFDKIATIDVATALIYQIILILFAWYDMGVWSFVLANVISIFFSIVVCYKISPWQIGFACDRLYLKSSAKFGGIFQLSGMTSILRDNIIPVLATPMFGVEATGYLKWSFNATGQFSQRLTRIITQVAFPSFSRLQNDRFYLETLLNKMLRYANITTILLLGILLALLPETITLIFDDKWIPAVFSFQCFAVAMLAFNFTTIIDNFFKGIGKVKKSLRIMVSWTIVLWSVSFLSMHFWGFNGIAIAIALGGWFAAIYLILELHYLGYIIRLPYVLYRPLFSGLVMMYTIMKIKTFFPINLYFLIFEMLACVLFYIIIIFVLERMNFVNDLIKDFLIVKSAIQRKI